MRISSPESLQRPRATTIPTPNSSGMIDDGVEKLRNACRIMRSNTKRAQRKSIRSLAKSFIQKLAFKGLIHLVTLMRDAFDRGAPEEDLRALERELAAMVDQWMIERDGARVIDFVAVHRVEEHSEGLQEETEIDLAYDPSPRHASLFIEAASRHMASIKRMIQAAYRIRDGVRA